MAKPIGSGPRSSRCCLLLHRPETVSGSQTAGEPPGPGGDFIRPPDRHPLGAPPHRDGVQLGDDLLAATARLAAGGGSRLHRALLTRLHQAD